MWLLNVTTHKLEYFEGESLPPYAILSHRWGQEEVTFKEVMKSRLFAHKHGWRKIKLCCEQIVKDYLVTNLNNLVGEVQRLCSYLWVDSCCIDKSNSSELSEAINSMYKWYRNAIRCYAFLEDVDDGPGRNLARSIWFSRGWTLQELLAPLELKFYDRDFTHLGSRAELCESLFEITGIPREALIKFRPTSYSVAQKMSWAARRHTTRVEDQAYCLLGIFNINMPLIYGEGSRAFRRLQEEILRTTFDLTIFAFNDPPPDGLDQDDNLRHDLARSARQFYREHGVLKRLRYSTDQKVPLNNPDQTRLVEILEVDGQGYTITASGIELNVYAVPFFYNVFFVPLCQIDAAGENGTLKAQIPGLGTQNVYYGSILGMYVSRLCGGFYGRLSAGHEDLLMACNGNLQKGRICKMMFTGMTLVALPMFHLEGRIESLLLPNNARYGFELHPIMAPAESKIMVFARFKENKKIPPMNMPLGEHGVAGMISVRHTTTHVYWHVFGFDVDFQPFWLVMMKKEESHTEQLPDQIYLSIPRLGVPGIRLHDTQALMQLVTTLQRENTHGVNMAQDNVELRVAHTKHLQDGPSKHSLLRAERFILTSKNVGAVTFELLPWGNVRTLHHIGLEVRLWTNSVTNDDDGDDKQREEPPSSQEHHPYSVWQPITFDRYSLRR